MKNTYALQLRHLLEGQITEAAQASYRQREDLDLKHDERIERRLIAIRFALKAGNLQHISLSQLNEASTPNVFLKAEILFVKATFFAQTGKHSEAAQSYHASAQYYLNDGNKHRAALALFNFFIAKTYAQPISWEEEQAELASLLSFTQKEDFPSVEFLAQRHVSFRHFERKEFQTAIDVLLPWLGRKDSLTKSDSELAILHLADCYFELGNIRQALFYLDQIPSQVDERVRFPRAFVESKILQRPIDINDFPTASSHWRGRYEKFARRLRKENSASLSSLEIRWIPSSGVMLRGKSLVGKIKPQSLEGQIIRLLQDGPRDKAFLCESLWPSELETEYLEDRFHQLIQRVNRKVKGLIVFDGRCYALSTKITI